MQFNVIVEKTGILKEILLNNSKAILKVLAYFSISSRVDNVLAS